MEPGFPDIAGRRRCPCRRSPPLYTAWRARRSVTVTGPRNVREPRAGVRQPRRGLDWTAEVRLDGRRHAAATSPRAPSSAWSSRAALALYNRAASSRPRASPRDLRRRHPGRPRARRVRCGARRRAAGRRTSSSTAAGTRPRRCCRSPSQLEHHGDNAAPALLGGLQVVVAEDDVGVVHVGIEPPHRPAARAARPEFSMPTEESRAKLPRVAHAQPGGAQHRPRGAARGRAHAGALRPAATSRPRTCCTSLRARRSSRRCTRSSRRRAMPARTASTSRAAARRSPPSPPATPRTSRARCARRQPPAASRPRHASAD